VLPGALLLKGAEETSNHPVLLRGVGRDEFLRETVVAARATKAAALKNKAIVAAYDGRGAGRNRAFARVAGFSLSAASSGRRCAAGKLALGGTVTKPGVTPSEAYLARLCGKTFLRMWSYPHLYKDQRKKRGGDGKELCDLLVVFGEHLLIFSDKDIELREDADTAIAWSRWYRKAVLDSAGQVFGAERWLREHPDRVFTDPECARRLPVELPRSPRVHRILTCRGASAACAKALGGSGSLMVTNRKLEECKDTPFQVGAFDAVGNVFHVLDEAVLDVVLRTLDTVSDFVEYLSFQIIEVASRF